jgi:hypothetical protein
MYQILIKFEFKMRAKVQSKNKLMKLYFTKNHKKFLF